MNDWHTLTIFIYIDYKENNPSFLRSGFMKTDKIVFLYFFAGSLQCFWQKSEEQNNN